MARAGEDITLSPAQAKVVTAPSGRRVFLAAAGAGKTVALAERAARLVGGGVPSEKVLLLAPSRQAAVGLGRLAQQRMSRWADSSLVGNANGLVQGAERGPAPPLSPLATSFHGFALTVLRRHYRDLGFQRAPELMTTARQFHELRQLLATEDDALWPHFPNHAGSTALRRFAYDVVMGAAENGLDANELTSRAKLWGKPELEDLAAFATRYRGRLRAGTEIDFGELLAMTIDLLAARPDVAAVYRDTFRHILVDEAEQANYAHIALLAQLLDKDTDLLIAGDPAHAINSYRGGSLDNLLSCPELLAAEVIVSEENHRAARRVASIGRYTRPAVRAQIETAAADAPAGGRQSGDGDPAAPARAVGEAGVPSAVRDDPADGRVVLGSFTFPSDEARWVVDELAGVLRRGTPAAAIAVLLRSLGTPVAELIAAELSRRGIPHHVAASRGVPADVLVRGTVVLLRYLASTRDGGESGDDEQRAAILSELLDSPLAGLPAFGLWELNRALARTGRSVVSLAVEGMDGLLVGPPVRLAVSRLFERLRELREQMGGGTASLLWQIWRRWPAYRDDAEAGGRGSAVLAALMDEVAVLEERRVANRDPQAEALPGGRSACRGDRRSPASPSPIATPLGPLPIEEFLALIDAGYFDQVTAEAATADGITITTVHRAKGREWETVFLPGLVEGAFPLRRSPVDLGPMVSRQLPEAISQDPSEAAAEFVAVLENRHREEERRIFQVAVTRARFALYMSYSRRGQDGAAAQLPSRFLSHVLASPGVEVVMAPAETPPLNVDDAVVYYRRRLTAGEPLVRAQALYALDQLRGGVVIGPERWWDNIVETAAEMPAFPAGSLRLSASRLGAYRNCPLAYQFGYHWRLGEPEGAALTIGSLLHSVLEEYHQPDSPLPRSRTSLETLLDRHYDPGAFRYRPIARQARKALGKMLDSYFVRYGQASSMVALERRFSFEFGPHVVSGFIDRIDRLAGGRLEIIDYKTGQAMSKNEAETDLQLALYDMAFYFDQGLQALGKPALVSYLYLKAIGSKADGKRSYAPTDDGRKRLAARVSSYAAAIVAEQFPAYRAIGDACSDLDVAELERAIRNNPCRFCSFIWVCPEKERAADNGGSES